MFQFFRRQPKPITVTIGEHVHQLALGEGFEAMAQDGSKLVVIRDPETGAIDITSYGSVRRPVRGVMPRVGR